MPIHLLLGQFNTKDYFLAFVHMRMSKQLSMLPRKQGLADVLWRRKLNSLGCVRAVVANHKHAKLMERRVWLKLECLDTNFQCASSGKYSPPRTAEEHYSWIMNGQNYLVETVKFALKVSMAPRSLTSRQYLNHDSPKHSRGAMHTKTNSKNRFPSTRFFHAPYHSL